MKLEQLEIENFKCFKSKKTFDFGRITILTGANSSGKSTVMQAILMLIQSADMPFELTINGRFLELGDFREIVNNNDITKNISFKIKFANKFDYHGRYSKWEIGASWHLRDYDEQAQLNTLEVGFENSRFDKHGFFKTNSDKTFDVKTSYDYLLDEDAIEALKLNENLKKLNVQILDDGRNVEIKNIDFGSLFRFFEKKIKNKDGAVMLIQDEELVDLIKLQSKLKDIFKELYSQNNFNFIGSQRKELPKNLMFRSGINEVIGDGDGYLDQIFKWEKNKSSQLGSLIDNVKFIGIVDNIKAHSLGGGRFEIQVKVKENSQLVSLSNVGSGVSHFLPIAVADLQLSNSSTLLLAEPETHLHPSIQSKFGDYLINQIKNTDKNYIIETHSEYLLNRLRLAIVKGELKKEDLKVYFLENDGEDTAVSNIEFTKSGEIKNAPQGFFETYLMDTMEIALNAFAE
jgi:AAA15 family ATPase/GTPase